MVKKEYLFELIQNGYKTERDYNLAVSRFIKRLKNAGALDIANVIQNIQMDNTKATKASKIKRVNDVLLFYPQEVIDAGDLIAKGYQTDLVHSAILYGKPGTGKTTFVKEMGKKYGTDILEVNLSAIMDYRYGESIKNLEEILSKNKDKKQIIFFDEADSLFSKRGQKNDVYETNRILTTMLRILDQQRKALIIFATNLIDVIDPAILRRFDVKVNFDVNNTKQKEIFEHLLFSYHLKLNKSEIEKYFNILSKADIDYSIADLNLLAKRIAIYKMYGEKDAHIADKLKFAINEINTSHSYNKKEGR